MREDPLHDAAAPRSPADRCRPIGRGAHALPLAALLACATGCGGNGSRIDRHHIADAGALGPYSAAVLSGELAFLSGKIGERGGTFEHEVQTALDAVERDLARCGLGMSDIVAAQVFLTDMDRYAEFNAIYAERVPAPHPARAVVEVRRLPGDARVEVMVTARR